jgi:hypothetical protein
LVQIVLIVLAAAVVLLFLAAALKPPTFRVQRSARIAAPPERIYPLLADFRRWRAWSPWEGLDPDLERTYGGSPTGKGATYAWDGNKKAGAGAMEITEESAPYAVGIDLHFTRPFPAHNRSEFRLKPDGRSTDVTWAMHGPQSLLMRVMCLFYPMDKLIGPDFEKGLAQLKTEAERSGQPSS